MKARGRGARAAMAVLGGTAEIKNEPRSGSKPPGAEDQKSMPPPVGIAGGVSFFGSSATRASVVISSEATEAAS